MPVFVFMDPWSSRNSPLDFYKVFLLNSQNQLLSSFKHIIHFQTQKLLNTLPQTQVFQTNQTNQHVSKHPEARRIFLHRPETRRLILHRSTRRWLFLHRPTRRWLFLHSPTCRRILLHSPALLDTSLQLASGTSSESTTKH